MMASGPARQLAFDLAHQESFAADDFLRSASNAAALAAVERWPDWPTPLLAIVGPSGSGKSHLTAIWAQRAGARGVGARALDRIGVPAALATGALAVEEVSAGSIDETAFFHLLNLAREEGASVLFTSQDAPALWSTRLPDLASRLKTVPAVRIDRPDDELLRGIIGKLFADRQIDAEPALIDFVLTRIERTPSAAQAAVYHIDAEALRTRRRVNRALAADVLRSLEAG